MAVSHPKCKGTQKSLCGYNCPKCFQLSFASSEKACFWSSENDVTPRQVFKGARSVYKFDCKKCKHEFESSLNSVTHCGSWCPYCKSGKLCDNKCDMCFDKSFASNPKAEFWSSKNELTARQTCKNSNTKCWFGCKDCGHDFEVRLTDCNQRGNWCSYCAGKKLCQEECDTCFNRSFASHPTSLFWSDENSCKPREVMKNSHTKYIFVCGDCNHSFKMSLDSATKGRWCSYCNGDLLCEENCDFCFENSFASNYRAEYWSPDNDKQPRQVRKNTKKKYKFDCEQCNHEFEGILANIIQNDAWCPYCSSPPKRLCDDDCDHCYNNSAASHPRAKFWSPLNKREARTVFKNAHTKYIYICDECDFPFETTPNHIASGNWCPLCKNKTERKLYFWLLELYPDYKISKPGKQKFSWCINPETGKFLLFDFYIEELGIIIELDGPQHFRQVHNWGTPEEAQAKDRYKEGTALAQGLSLIRILQEDVLRDDHHWDDHLRDVLSFKDSASIWSIYEDQVEWSWYE